MRGNTEWFDRVRLGRTCILAGLAALSLLMLVAVGGALGQEEGEEEEEQPAEISNAYLRLVFDNISGDDPQGDFALLSTGGDPLTGADNSRILSDRIDPYPQDMRTVVAIDWTSAGGGQFVNFGRNGEEGTETQTKALGLVEVDPVRQRIIAEWDAPSGVLRMRETLTLLRDVLEVRYRLRNTDTVSHTFGLRVTLDIRPNSIALDAGSNNLPETPLFVPGSGPISNEVKYKAASVPDRWWCGVPTTRQATVMGGFLANFAGARRPDEFHIGNLANLQGDQWEFEPGESARIEDMGVSVRWNPVRVSPNQSVEFVTYFGYASASGDYSSPFVLAAVSPARLALTSGDNPNTPETEQMYISPDPFEVRAYVYNVSDLPQGNAVLFLSLPQGLEFATGESASKLIDAVPSRSERMVSWNLRATGRPAGTLAYLLSANISPSAARTVTRQVLVPPVTATDLVSGTSMVSVPFALADATPDAAISLTPAGALQMAKWDPREEQYVLSTDPAFGVLERGRGYWLRVDSQSTLSVVGASAPGQEDIFVPLEEGWNQIGDPFELPLEWGRTKVAFEDETLTLIEAVRRGLLRSTLFWWDPVLHEYRWSVDTSYRLEPWGGYWIRVNLPCTLVFVRQEITRERLPSGEEGRLEVSRVPADGWGVELAAVAGKEKARCIIGASPEGRDGYDSWDIEAPPPALGAGLSLSVPHSDWGAAAGSYVQDIRQQRLSDARWQVEVKTAEPYQEVLLTWPDLRKVPKNVALYLEREDTRQRVSMRTANGLTLNTGASGRIRVAVVVGAAGEVLVVSTPHTGEGRGSLAFSFDLSMDAEVSASISNLAGTQVRQLASGLSLGAGNQSLAWDARDEAGARVPAGTYVLEIEALSWDGQRFVASRTFSVQ